MWERKTKRWKTVWKLTQNIRRETCSLCWRKEIDLNGFQIYLGDVLYNKIHFKKEEVGFVLGLCSGSSLQLLTQQSVCFGLPLVCVLVLRVTWAPTLWNTHLTSNITVLLLQIDWRLNVMILLAESGCHLLVAESLSLCFAARKIKYRFETKITK